MPHFYIKNELVVGQVTCHGGPGGGYRYMPFTSARRSSRKAHATPEEAVQGREKGGRLIECANVREAMAKAKEH